MTKQPMTDDKLDINPAAEIDEVVFDDYENTPDDSPPTAEDSMRYYGVDFDIAGLVRRLNEGDLAVPSFDPSYNEAKSGIEGFQRRFVWPKKQMDRFIESLLLGYPVPGIFLLERPNRKFLVLDGQQRLKTLQAFYAGTYHLQGGKEAIFSLENVGEQFRGKTYKNLSVADKRLLDSTILQATIVIPKEENLEAVYLVFERINSTGIKLQPQEIRVALYSGEMISLLRQLNGIDSWRRLFGPPHSRLKDHELILRYLLLTESAEIFTKHNWDRDAARKDAENGEKVYRSGMASSLNRYLSRHRHLEGLDSQKIIREFTEITKLLEEGVGKAALRPRGNQINAAHTDALLVGLTLALRKGKKLTPTVVKQAYKKLVDDENYMNVILESTAHLESVVTRLEIAERVFSEAAEK